MAGGSGRAVAETSSNGFFLGRKVGSPGPLFYPIAAAFRTSILSLPGIALAAVWAVRRRRDDQHAKAAVALLAFALGFMLLLTVAPKKADRYLLPSIVAADVALGIAAGAWIQRNAKRSTVFATAGVVALAIHGGPAIALDPYQNAAYNWLVGGPVTAEHAMVVGWGEGLDEAAQRLSLLPGAESLTVAVSRVTQFAGFFVGKAIRIEDSSLDHPGGERADLVLFYISSVQAGKYDRIWQQYRDRKPLYELTINRIPYVRVYRASG
jgi:hypothetical protein